MDLQLGRGIVSMAVEHRAIAIGGSTGAVKDLQRILGALPANLPAAVFVVVHVGAHGRDLLAKTFEGCGPLPVATAEDGEAIESGHVYIAPADRHLLVMEGAIRLGRGPRENIARPSVDALFRSVALSYGARAIGLVITGHLNDGASGLAAIGQRGGATVVQNPSDAEAPDMPIGALEASDVDYRAPTEELASLVTALAQQAPGPEVQASKALELEVDIALGRPCRSTAIAEIAHPVAITCPACAGVLSEIKEPPLRFRCQVGHGYTAEALAQEQEGSLDEAVRVVLRIVGERATLTERMASDAQAADRSYAHRDLSDKARELRTYEEVLRRVALRWMDAPQADL
jgi:two-component system, chemotaxis family, protein-glutamate methylesterase/glutaminase